jgi:ferredoxin
MPTVVTVTAEVEALGECGYCGQAMAISPVLHGIELNGSYVCDPCFFYRFNGSRAQAAQALGRGAEGDDDGPAAPAARPRTLWLLIGGQAVPRELTPAEEAELDDFEREVLASAPAPEPCTVCGRPASPFVATEVGPLCLACADDGAGGPALQRDVRLALVSRTALRLTVARAAQAVTDALTTCPAVPMAVR